MQLYPAFSLKPPSTYMVHSADLSILHFSILTPVHFPTSLLLPVLSHFTLQFLFSPSIQPTNSPLLIVPIFLCFVLPQFSPFLDYSSFFKYFSFPHLSPLLSSSSLSLKAYQKMTKPVQIASFSPDLSQQRKIKH